MDRLFVGCWTWWCLGALVTWCASGALGMEYFVAINGRDENPGTRAWPFATLERARDAIRDLKRTRGGLPEGGVTVWLRGGTYPRERSFELTAEDSGTAAAPVVYRAWEGESVRLLGGISIPPEAFCPVTEAEVLERLEEGARGHVLQADLKSLGIADLGEPFPVTFRGYAGWPEVFFAGRPMVLARWPNEGFARVAQVVDTGSRPRWNEKPDRPGTFMYDGDRPARWLKAPEAYLEGYWAFKWYSESIRIARIDAEAKTITLAAPHLYGLGGPSGGEYYAFNLLEELDAPGEYYLDRERGILYFWPPSELAGREVVVSILRKPLVSLRGATRVVLRDLIFEGSRGMAVTVEDGFENLIAGCTVRNIAGDAIRIEGGANNGVVACDMYKMGGGGVWLSGGDRPTLRSCGNYAANNHIHHYARLYRTHHDAIFLGGVGCRASHNLIHDAPHHAIDFSGNEHTIEFNEIHHVCLETDDAGAIYTGRDWTVRGTVIRHNFFHHIGGGPAVGNQAIYLDDTACGTTCFGNVIYQVYRAFLIGGGRDNVVDGNLIVECPIPVHIDNRGMGGEWVEGQEVYYTLRNRLQEVPYRDEPWRSRYPTLANILEDEPGLPKGNEVLCNVMVRCGGMDLASEAQQYGVFANNWETMEDAGIANAAQLDFRMSEDAPAFRAAPGFPRIPFEQIGLVRDAYRRVLPAHAPWITPEPGPFAGELELTMGTRSQGAVIHYTLDGSEPGLASPLYQGPLKIAETVTVKAAAFPLEGQEMGRSEVMSATYTACRLEPGQGVYLSDLRPRQAFCHGGLLKDLSYGGQPIRLRGQAFAKGLVTHPEASPEGGRAHVTYVLDGGLATARRLRARVGIDDTALNRGSAVFSVEVCRAGVWETVYQSPVLRGGGHVADVDVDIAGAEQVRLSVTDAGDGIHSDHATWAGARLE